MANPVVNNNGGAALSANGTYCQIQVPGFIQNVPASCVQPQFWEASYYLLAGSTGVGTVVTFQSEANDGTWTNLSSPAPITVASGQTYNSTIQAPVGGLRLVVSGLIGNGIAYAQLAGIEVPIVSGGGQATSQSPKTTSTIPAVVQGPKEALSGTGITNFSLAYTSNVSAGSTLIVTVNWNDITSNVVSVKDNLNAPNWTLASGVQRGPVGAVSGAIYYYYNTLAGPCTVTLTLNQTAQFLELTLLEVANLSGVVDGAKSNGGNNLVTADPGTIVTTAANDFLVASCPNTTATLAGAGGSWVFTEWGSSSTGYQYLNAGAAGSYDPVFTTDGAGEWVTVAAAFAPAGSTTTTSRYTVFPPANVPANNYNGFSQPVTSGLNFFVSKAATATAVRFYKVSGDGTSSHTVGIFDVSTGSLLVSKASSSEPSSGWVEVSFTTPLALAANHPYQAAALQPVGFDPYTNGIFSSAKTNGPLTAYADGSTPSITYNGTNNSASASGLSFATGHDSQTWYGVDVVIYA